MVNKNKNRSCYIANLYYVVRYTMVACIEHIDFLVITPPTIQYSNDYIAFTLHQVVYVI